MPKGGRREGAGRKSKSEEQKLAEKLGEFETEALAALKDGVTSGRSWAIQLYMNYMYGKPKESIRNEHVFDNFNIKEALTFKK